METLTPARTISDCGWRARRVSRVRSHRAVFLDRDGTLIVDQPYNADPEAITLLPGTLESLWLLGNAGYRLIVVTNQSGVARGYYGLDEVARMHTRLDELLRPIGQPILCYYACPHHCQGSVAEFARACLSRKPNPGMLLRAANDWSIDLRRSWMIGDLDTDVQAGLAAGCRPIQIGRSSASAAAPRAGSLAEAARQIIARDAIAPRWMMKGPRVARPD